MNNPKFIVVKYPPGGAGKFLISIIMSSRDVAHYDPDVENDKTPENCIAYIRNSFTPMIKNWMLNEPNDKFTWNTTFYSNKYARGNDLTLDEFVERAKTTCTEHFHNCVSKNKFIPLVWHKVNTAPFFADSKVLFIRVDNSAEKWHHRALWNKLYGTKNGKIHLKINDPEYNLPMKEIMSKFKNPIYSEDTFYTFAKKNIINNEFAIPFSKDKEIVPQPNQKIIKLSDILNSSLFHSLAADIFKFLEIEPADEKVLKFAHAHWCSCHLFKYS